jgi:hypothetical protein
VGCFSFIGLPESEGSRVINVRQFPSLTFLTTLNSGTFLGFFRTGLILGGNLSRGG